MSDSFEETSKKYRCAIGHEVESEMFNGFPVIRLLGEEDVIPCLKCISDFLKTCGAVMEKVDNE